MPARKVFFSFHYQNDSWRVSQVRNSWMTKGAANSFFDRAEWETVQRGGRASIKSWIDSQLKGTSVTVVLIGDETYKREWVLYELKESYKRGNGIVGVNINKLKNQYGSTGGGLFTFKGGNPLEEVEVSKSLIFSKTLCDIFSTYDWVDDDGYNNFESWVELSLEQAINHGSRK